MFNLQILNKNIWSKYVKDGELSIAVIGNAGVSEQDNNSIQKCNCHVRFNNYATRADIQDKLTADPLRCDVLFSTFDLHSKGAAPKDAIITIPFPFKQKRIARLAQKWYPRSQKWMVNPYLLAEYCEELGLDSEGWRHPCPSVGMTCLMNLRDHLDQLKIKSRVFVAGFEWYYNKKKNSFQNWDLRRTDHPKTWNHNYPKEVEWVYDNLVNHAGFTFSGRAARILNYAKKLILERRSLTK